MTKRGNIAKLRGVLRLGALVFALSAALLLALPSLFAELLGLAASDELNWSLQMIGLTLLALTGQMFVVSLSASGRGVLWAARVMQVAAFFLGVVTLLIPTGVQWFVILYALVGFGFSAAYTVFLLQKRSGEE
jgi:hypothetical protein